MANIFSPLAPYSARTSAHERTRFFDDVVQVLCGTLATSTLDAHTVAESDPVALMLAAKALVCRIASTSYAPQAVVEQLATAGIVGGAAREIISSVEAAVLPRASELRQASALAAAQSTEAWLVDFDWQLQLVLSSSTHANIREAVVDLELTTRPAGGSSEVRSVVELSAADLDSFLEACKGVKGALHSLPEPTAK
uniref:COMM domain-containing protein n=1 Tax=Coccolithus braarudii TaxID=221442 RepID=A0A7S0L4X5_9EUKA